MGTSNSIKRRSATRLLAFTVLAAVLVFLCTSVASAGLLTIAGTPVDTVTGLSVTWAWEDIAASPAAVYTENFNGTNWQANLSIGPEYSPLGWLVSWGFQHKTGPHPEDVNPAPFFSKGGFAFNSTGEVINTSGAWGHPTTNGSHDDIYSFIFTRSAGLDTITLNVAHAAAPVPEPATLLLLGTGLIGAVAAKRRKRK